MRGNNHRRVCIGALPSHSALYIVSRATARVGVVALRVTIVMSEGIEIIS